MRATLKPLIGWFGTGVVASLIAAALLPDAALAGVSALAAVVLAVLVPARVASRGPKRAGIDGLAVLSGVAAVALAVAPSVGALAAIAYLAAGVLALACWSRVLGQTAGTVLALGVVALPYVGGVPLGLLDDGTALEVVLHSPLSFLCGTCAEVDLLRQGSLYRLLPQAQSSAYSYAPIHEGLLLMGGCAVLGLIALATRRAWRPRRVPAPALAAAALVMVLATPSDAEAQLFPESGAAGGSGIGDMTTRVRLGYWLPTLRDYLRVAGPTTPGDRLRYTSDLDLDRIFILPTFEIAVYWPNGGGVVLHYMEGIWKGEENGIEDLDFEGITLRRGDFYESKYRFRTIAFTEYLDIPLSDLGLDFITFQIVTTQRYFKHEFRTRSVPFGVSARDSLEGLIPQIGVGADILLWEMISIYGDLQWLDFTTELFGGDDEEIAYKVREWKAGVRLELVDQAHISVEWFSLETTVAEGDAKYKQALKGGRIQVSILF